MKKTLTLLFLYNAEVRYALQLRHLSNKIQIAYVTRKSRIDSGYHKVSFEKQITFTEGAHILDIFIRLKTDFIFNKHLS